MKRMNWIAASLLFSGVVASLLFGACSKSGIKAAAGGKSYEYTKIARGSIEKTVSASGTLEATSEVDVLSQMSGRVEKVYATYNQTVKKGEVLATLNTDMLKLQAEEEAAAVKKAQATYDLQLLNYQNQQKLAEKGLVSDYDLKSAKTTLDVDSAELASAQAALKVIETEINQYAYITSPIDGIVLDRNIEEGSSVVSSSSSSSTSLFTLAENLSRMDIKAEVDELDIASIKKGQTARFTVEALPGQTFMGTVTEIRLVPKTSSNVVSYYVIVEAQNKGGKLLPGMTATVSFIEQSRENVLLVQNAALRFQPTTLTAAQIARKVYEAGLAGTDAEKTAAMAKYDEDAKAAADAAAQKSSASSSGNGLAGLVMNGSRGPGMPGQWNGQRNRNTASSSGDAPAAAVKKPLWYLDDKGEFQVIMVEVGVSNGMSTEVAGDGLEGKSVILREKVS